ncbi:MAG: FtsX-like permease family protein [Acidimicrobiales bacterium]
MTSQQRPRDIGNYARIQATPLALALTLALLGIATLANVLLTSIRRRRRDLAVLKTLGFVRRQVSATVAWQSTAFAVVALVVGLPVGVAAGSKVWEVFADSIGVSRDAAVPVLWILVAVPVTLVLANLIAAGPGWAAGRVRPATVLRSE